MREARQALAPPAGMRDLLHPQAWQRRQLAQRLLGFFASHGYDLVDTPPFEHAEVLERGLDAFDRRDLLRFVEPESGEVALLRPDITPQVARIVATQLRERPAPWRLAYEGTVVRRRHGRARRQRQIAQAGVELIGSGGALADAEVVRLAARACEHVGLRSFRIELSQIALAQAVLGSLPEAAQAPAAAALASKDKHALAALEQAGLVPAAAAQGLLQRIDLYGDASVLAEAQRLLRTPAEQQCLAHLAEVVATLQADGLGDRLGIDLGEVRDRAYYTGMHFSVLAEGPGEAVAAGGRYDDLLGRFGTPLPASGFALDLDHLQWALDSQAQGAKSVGSQAGGSATPDALPPRLVWAADEADSKAGEAGKASGAAAWRALGAHVAPFAGSEADAVGFGRAWGYDGAVGHADGGLHLLRLHDGAKRALPEAGDGKGMAAALLWLKAGR